MGSATFALPSLNRLFERGYEITGVITQPDKPSGRGQTVQSPPVKRRAFDLHLPIYQPSSLKTEETQSLIQALRLDVIVVVAYGKILPPWLLQFPSYGCINVHGSILPKYRGAAPVHWAIANGEKSTGVCTMLLDEGLDTGPLYLCRETLIDPNETTAELYNRLADLGADALIDTLEGVMNSSLKPTPQDNSKATFAPILKKEHGFIDWHMAAVEIHNRVRAFNPWPGTVAKFRGVTCKIVKTAIGESAEAQARQPAAPLQSGSIVVARGSLAVVCGDGALLEIVLIQPENRKVVSGADFANGARIHPDEKFEALLDN
ncbi:MAG: methionyl-tRNA formyltransferase [Acidobacteria bacterium]|nr:MAG: methionyl-tRNA formyltransferase [Acidobacteriota bacterium]